MKAADFTERYWHELTHDEKTWLTTKSKKSWQWLVDNVKQPNWCEYPQALMHEMGCWSLILSNSDGTWREITPKFCKPCDISKWGRRKMHRRIFINRLLRRGRFRKK